MNRILLNILTMSALLGASFGSIAQVQITYGGINPPEMPALVGTEYLAKLDDNKFFTGSSTQNSLTLLSFDENTPDTPFQLLQNWMGEVDGFSLGSVKDQHYDEATNKLFVVQQNPARLVVLDFESGTNALTFHSSTDLTGMATPERFAMTDELIIVLDVEGHKAADLSFDGLNSPSLIQVHDLATCGVEGDYKDLELAPNGDYAYITCFSPANLIKLSLSPTGMTCNGIIDLNAMLGASLIGDLTFIAEDRAFVTTCIGQSGILRMEANGDFTDPIPGSSGIFDAMRSIYFPSDSILVMQSSGGTGGTYKVNSDYSFTQLATVTYSNTFNKELITMAGEAVVRSEDGNGSLGLLIREEGIYQDASRTFAGGVVIPERMFFSRSISLDGDNDIVYSCGLNGIAAHQIQPNGSLINHSFYSNLDFTYNEVIAKLNGEDILAFSPQNMTVRTMNMDWAQSSLTLISDASVSGVSSSNIWRVLTDDSGNTVILVPTVGNEVFVVKLGANNEITAVTNLSIPNVLATANLTADIAPSSDKIVVVAEQSCVETLFEIERTGQDWSISDSYELSSQGSVQCPVKGLHFLGVDDKVGMITNSGVFQFELGNPEPASSYLFLPNDNVNLVNTTAYNADHDLLFVSHSGFSEFELRAYSLSAGIAFQPDIQQLFSNGGNIHGLDNIYQIVSSGNSAFALDQQSMMIHPIGIEDMLVSANEMADGQLKLVPNPNNGYFSIQFIEPFNGTITVVDNVGRIVLTRNMNGTSLIDVDLNDHPAGLYHVTCTSLQGARTSQRLVRQD